ncbi:Dam family site-specific DNA-(adenine-N6)-methyltransferase [Vibrio vulnificus]|nr:Dam family site-specific DNA-(adenine-N6)-methyltransferase [Vibrio vulnificus]
MSIYPVFTSPLKYAGNKKFLAQRLERLILKEIGVDAHIVEPFSGSLGFSLYYGFRSVHANDVNRPLINFFQQIQLGRSVRCPTEVSEAIYLEYRERFNTLVSNNEYTPEMASYLLYLNFIGFNGLMRTNLSGRFNVPYGKDSRGNDKIFPPTFFDQYEAMHSLISKWSFSSRCFTQVLNDAHDADLVYADPPYQDTFTAYSGGKFDWESQVVLCDMLSRLDCPIIVSNSLSNQELLRMYADHGFRLYRTKKTRSIAAKSSARRSVYELVAFKNFTTKNIGALCPQLTLVTIR